MNSLFDQNDEINPQLDQSKNYLDELVGDGKKFKSVEDLARGKAEADLYIETLNKRADQLREDYIKMREEATAQAKLQDLIDRLENRTTPQLPAESPERQPTPSFDVSKLPSLIREESIKLESERKADANFKAVQNKLKEQFGHNVQQVLQDRMNSLDLSIEDINSLARKSPTAFYNTLGLNNTQPQESLIAPPRSSNNVGFQPRGETKRTWSYYENLRKSNPKIYYDPKIANQMHDDQVRLGEAFQDGDFHA